VTYDGHVGEAAHSGVEPRVLHHDRQVTLDDQPIGNIARYSRSFDQLEAVKPYVPASLGSNRDLDSSNGFSILEVQC